MKLTAKLSMLFFAAMAFVLIACNETTTPTDNKTPEPATKLMATSLDSTSIKIKWDASTSESDTEFSGYLVKISTPTGVLKTDTVNKLKNPYTVTGLNQGMLYTIELKALFTNGNSSSAVTVNWSPAYRFVKNINSEVIRMYSSNSTLGSGLQLFDMANLAPKTVTVANGAVWNFGLDTKNGAVLVGSPSQLSYSYTGTPKLTEISTSYYDATSLNDVYESQSLDKGTFSELAIDLLKDVTIKNNIVLVLRAQDTNGNTHYAKILIKKGGDGNWLQGTADNRYIECEVSYQNSPNVPYAKRGF